MNFLDLCREAARESGTLSGGAGEIVTTIGNTVGRIDKIVSWVRDAYVNIQLEHGDYFWMRREFDRPLTGGKARYTAADLTLTRVGTWVTDDDTGLPFTLQDPDLTQANESGIPYSGYGGWRSRYGRGLHDASRPTEFSVSPAGEIVFGATPDKAYILRGAFVATPQILSAPTDVPEMPEQFHKIIVWEAVKLMAIADEAPTSIQTAVGEYARLRDALAREQRPRAYISFASDVVIA